MSRCSRSHGQCSFSLKAKDEVTEGNISKYQTHLKHTDPTHGQPCAFLPGMSCFRSWLVGELRVLPMASRWQGAGRKGRTAVGETLAWEATAQQTPPRRRFPHIPLAGSVRRDSRNHTHTEALSRQEMRGTVVCPNQDERLAFPFLSGCLELP